MACGASWASSLSLPKMLNVLTLTGVSTVAVAGAEELGLVLGVLAALPPPEFRRLLLMISAVATSAAITSTTTMVTATRLAPPPRGPRPGGPCGGYAVPRPRSGSAQLLWSSAFGG